jgi:hypothetical protein
MNKKIMGLHLSLQYSPDKSGQVLTGRKATCQFQTNLIAIAPFRGLGVNQNINK